MAEATPDGMVASLCAPDVTTRNRAWREFYALHAAAVYRMVFRCGVRPEDVEDVTQQVFMVAHDRADEVREMDNPRAWLRAVALRVVKKHRRRRHVVAVKHALFGSFARMRSQPVEAGEIGEEARRAQELVRRVIAKLPDKLSDVLILTDLEACKPSEAAQILGIPVNTVRSRRMLAREQFKKHWRRLAPKEPNS